MRFRTRLMLASLTTLAVGLGALVVLGNVLLDRRIETETSDLLRERAAAHIGGLIVTSNGVREVEAVNDSVLDRQAAWVFAGDRQIETPRGDVPPALDVAAHALSNAATARELKGPDETRLRVEPVRNRAGKQVATVVVAASTEAVHDLQKKVLFGSLVVAGLVLLAGALAIRRGVTGALQPVAEMTDAAAAAWGAQDLDRRFDIGPPRDELSGLAATLDGLLDRIAASRRHEQRFASEVAHELRTPLAGLRGRAELALGSGDEAERDAALLAVAEQTGRMSETIDSLMAAARQELGHTASAVDVAAVVRDLPDVELEIPDAVPAAEGDADLLRRALAPLVDNARRHAREHVSVAVGADDAWVRVTVRDDGPGLAADLGERAFEPGVQGGEGGGAGLGLPLARRLARTCGGDVTAGEGPGGCFVLTLPRAPG